MGREREREDTLGLEVYHESGILIVDFSNF